MVADRETAERVHVFDVDGTYLFRHYFEGEDVFARLKRYYNNRQYRFEVPPDRFESLRSFLADHGYEPVVVDDAAPFVVVVEQYTAHPENIFEESVARRSVEGYNCFLLTDRTAVARAVADDAAQLAETPLDNPF